MIGNGFMQFVSTAIDRTHPRIAEAIAARDGAAIRAIVRSQREAGASGFDVNLGLAPADGPESMTWLVNEVRIETGGIVSLDCGDVSTLVAGARACAGPLMLNSASLDEERLAPLARAAAEYKALLVLQPFRLGDGIQSPSQRAVSVRGVAPLLDSFGLGSADLVLDVLAEPLAVNPQAVLQSIEALAQMQAAMPGVKTIAGIYNVSYRVSGRLRHALHCVMAVCMGAAGLDFALCDPSEPGIVAAACSPTLAAKDLMGSFIAALATAVSRGALLDLSPWLNEPTLSEELRAVQLAGLAVAGKSGRAAFRLEGGPRSRLRPAN